MKQSRSCPVPWGSKNDKHSLQTGDQDNVSKPRTASRFQYTKTKISSTLLLGVPSVTSLESFKVSLLAPKKTVMYTTNVNGYYTVLNYLPYALQHPTLLCLLHCHAPCCQFILHPQLIVTLELVVFSAAISSAHRKGLLYKQSHSSSPQEILPYRARSWRDHRQSLVGHEESGTFSTLEGALCLEVPLHSLENTVIGS